MSKLPIPHIINTIKTKLGFDRAMTAPGEDVVDAVNKHSAEIANVQNGLAYIVGETNTTGKTLSVGAFVYVKGHSTITEGLRKVTTRISANGSITTNNTEACTEGGLNALNSKFTKSVVFLTGFNHDSGRYYYRVLTPIAASRFSFMILRGRQGEPAAAVVCVYEITSNEVYSTDPAVTWDKATNTITIDNGTSAWLQPIIICPEGYMQ